MSVQLGIQHLWCRRCETQPTPARFNGKARLVCNCAFARDDPLDAQPLDEHALLPDPWEYREE